MVRRTSSTNVRVALLRGINVGGKNKLPMSDLAAMFTDVGCEDVRTYIQSGNVVFKASASVARSAGDLVSTAILEQFGHRVPVVLRTARELNLAAGGNPYLTGDVDPAALHVAFLATRPTPAKVADLDPDRSPPDEFTVQGSHIYFFCPNGVARSKLTNKYFDSKLGTTSTVRNWRTVLKLVELCATY